MPYLPTPESIAQHPVPEWFHDAKLGIFVHWGLYSVPAWAPNSGELGEIIASGEWAKWFANNPYAEWYSNTLRIDGSPTRQHHNEVWPRLSLRSLRPPLQSGHPGVATGRMGRSLRPGGGALCGADDEASRRFPPLAQRPPQPLPARSPGRTGFGGRTDRSCAGAGYDNGPLLLRRAGLDLQRYSHPGYCSAAHLCPPKRRLY